MQTRPQREKHDPHGEDVAFGSPEALLPDLRRHVARSASRPRSCRELVGEAEVDDYDLGFLQILCFSCFSRGRGRGATRAGDHHVGLLEVTMHHVALMQKRHTRQNLMHHVGEPPLVDTDAGLMGLADHVREVASEVRLLHQVDVGLILEDVEDMRDAGVLQGHKKLKLPCDVLNRVVRTGLVVHFDDDFLLSRQGLAHEDSTLSALSKLGPHAIPLR
mmetsp:Transcript_13694/g.30165  ORF Transcript_13694/g.30165 Transcript_13694/m.30165 type:complete len:218 (+) Transcript_13694:518-1171(+)